jgi:pyridoxamine 5'-phosphate oxidase
VRAEGCIERLPDDEARTYFDTRARESRLGAWASPQSRPLADRSELDRLYAEADEQFSGDEVPLPVWWGGYRLVPDAFEVWQNRPNRLHDRARYERAGDGWSRTRLGP